jgi:hypothetical protein
MNSPVENAGWIRGGIAYSWLGVPPLYDDVGLEEVTDRRASFAAEFSASMSRIAISKPGRGGRRKLPWVFTEHGAIQAANVLNSDRAVTMGVYVRAKNGSACVHGRMDHLCPARGKELLPLPG